MVALRWGLTCQLCLPEGALWQVETRHREARAPAGSQLRGHGRNPRETLVAWTCLPFLAPRLCPRPLCCFVAGSLQETESGEVESPFVFLG